MFIWFELKTPSAPSDRSDPTMPAPGFWEYINIYNLNELEYEKSIISYILGLLVEMHLNSCDDLLI